MEHPHPDLSILGSTNGSSYSTSSGRPPTPGTLDRHTVTIPLPSGTADQYVEVNFNRQRVQNGAQASEIEIYG